tara:strand:- start:1686 stop:2678 length:993 start_codon:yes stop_codon:yes gene_type:complete
METKNESTYYNANSQQSRSTEDIIELEIPKKYAGLRLDQALTQILSKNSRNRIQTWILEKRITVDDLKVNPKKKVWGGENIRIKPTINLDKIKNIPEPLELNIVYEDQSILIINKPAGMVVHPGNGNWHGTMLNGLLHYYRKLEDIPRAGIVHRLDKNTSGLLVVAKTLEAQTHLGRQLQDRTMKRNYFALVHGNIDSNGEVNAPISRHPAQRIKMTINKNGKDARTSYIIKDKINGYTILQCSLDTGRTHQIRVHMLSIGHPIVGDPVYGTKPQKGSPKIRKLISEFPRQALHAKSLELIHPATNQKIMWKSNLPEDINMLLLKLSTII